jgi:DNA primase
VPTAVATCGTAFGGDHIAVLRRLLMDQDEMRGEVIFTFDGDSAGQKAALKAFGDEQKFVSQTYIAVSPESMDPCELRLARGDMSVRDMVAARVPLVEFALTQALTRYDLETAEGRVGALRAAAPLVARIKDRALRPEYARRLAGWLGMEVETVAATVAEQAGTSPHSGPGSAQRRPPPVPADIGDVAAVAAERELVKLAVQAPVLVSPQYDALAEDVFTHAGLQAVHKVIAGVGGTSGVAGGEPWVSRLLEACPEDRVRQLVTMLAVEAPLSDTTPDARAGACRHAPHHGAEEPAAARQPGRGARALLRPVR